MGFKSFRANVVLRLAVFVVLAYVAVWGFANTDWQLTPIVSALLAFVMLVELLRYVESMNRELASFLEFVRHDDFSASFPIGQKGKVFEDLEFAYKLLLDKYRSLNEARELNHRYLEELVEHVSVALLCLDNRGTVTLMNRQAKRLFKTPHLNNLRSLRRIDPTLPTELGSLADGDRILIRLRIDGESMQLALYVTEFELLGRGYKLISFQNIRDELERREVDFSQKLIKVLTHEIMNSVTPIIALCKVIEESLTEATSADSARRLSELPDADDLLRSVASIQSRGDGLVRFVQAYRSLTSLPKPNRKRVDIAALLEQTVTLLAPTFETANVALETRVDGKGLVVEADPEQLQQVLINVVKNAVEALDGRAHGKIVLSAAENDNGRTTIKVADNGPGIDEDQIENIFVPFFTTKRGGTGVGLSVSRQIMFLNRGLISVKSTPERGAEFSLQFRQ
jgi:nitrogen fixation/metabolism regulation signal transduction histidine kinase